MNGYDYKKTYIIGLLFISMILINNCSQLPTSQPDNSNNLVNKTKVESNGLNQINTEVLEHIMDGQLYLDQGDFAMAIVELQEALNIEPNISSIYISLAECYWNLKKPQRSVEYLETAIEIDPDDVTIRELLAEQLFRLQDFVGSEEQYIKLLDLNPGSENYLFALGDLAKIQKKYMQAIDYYNSIYEMNNNNIQALELTVDLKHRLGLNNEADELYRKLLKVDSLNVNYLSAYSDIKVQLNEAEEAVDLVKKIIQIEGSSIESLIQLGVLYNELGKYAESIEVFQKTLQQDSTNVASLHFLSTLYRENSEYGKAQLYADKMTLAFPENPQGIINSALIALDQDDSKKAISILSPAAADFPEEYSVQYLLGMSYNVAKNFKMAAVFLDNARQLAPNSRNTLHILAIVNDNLKNWHISDGLFQQLIDTDSTDAQAYNNYAYSLIERNEKNDDLSIKYSRRAIELAPNQAAYLDTYGWVLFKTGDTEKAHKYIKKSLQIDDGNVEVLKHMGDVLIKMKKYTEAVEYYHKALSLDPENQELINKLSDY